MGVGSARQLLGRGGAGYRGDDRRGIVERLSNPASSRLAIWGVALALLLPLAGAGALTLAPSLSAGAVALGASDAALVAFVAAGLALLCRWRLVGDASSVALAASGLVAGLLLVPVSHLGWAATGFIAALQLTAVAAIFVTAVAAFRLPEVCADLRSGLLVCSAVLGPLLLAVPLGLSPWPGGGAGGATAALVAGSGEAAACALAALLMVERGVKRQQPLFVGAAGFLLAVAAARLAATPILPASGGAAALPAFFLLVGGVELLLIAGVDLRSAFGAIVLHDVRGRRRWVAAESELDRVRRVYRGQSHDVTSLLTAVDGTLLVLATQAASLPEERSRQLLQSIRGQIERLTTILTEDRDHPVEYDLAELLAEAVALHAAGARPPRLRAEPGLVLSGHPHRVLRLVNNLLVNAARYAPLAQVTLSARRLAETTGGEVAELIVTDDGPGILDGDLEHAFEPGWRGGSGSVSGSGVGLFQCRDVVEAEGGTIRLGPTDPVGAPGARGLTARVRIPMDRFAPVSPNSSILQMSTRLEPVINGEAVPGRLVGPAKDGNAHQ